MEFLNKVQQVRAHAGSHEGAAILAGRFCQSGVLAIEAPSKDAQSREVLDPPEAFMEFLRS